MSRRGQRDDGETGTTSNISESENAEWRLDFWEEIVDRAPFHPVFGVGYGEPIAFTWRGLKYDFRDGDPAAAIDVDGPHNEFLHVLYRMGFVGLIGLLGAIAVALWRAVSALREGVDPERRARIVALTAMVLVASAVACFADSLKSPFLGLFFWTALGLLVASTAGRDELSGFYLRTGRCGADARAVLEGPGAGEGRERGRQKRCGA